MKKWWFVLAMAGTLSAASCGSDSGNGETNQPGATPPPAPQPTVTVTPVGQPDWSTASLTVVFCPGAAPPCETIQQFTVDDNGNYTQTAPSSSGRISDTELSLLDARIDAVKDDAHDPFDCELGAPFEIGYTVRLTFSNRGNAIVYRDNSERGETCRSGDPFAVNLLVLELLSLQGTA